MTLQIHCPEGTTFAKTNAFQVFLINSICTFNLNHREILLDTAPNYDIVGFIEIASKQIDTVTVDYVEDLRDDSIIAWSVQGASIVGLIAFVLLCKVIKRTKYELTSSDVDLPILKVDPMIEEMHGVGKSRGWTYKTPHGLNLSDEVDHSTKLTTQLQGLNKGILHEEIYYSD